MKLGAAALLWASLTGAPQSVQPVPTPSGYERRDVPLDVPFVAQGRLLCGGAAAAMVERFWGARGVYADDYSSLVRPDEGGIRASELVQAMHERGLDVEVAEDAPDRVLAWVAAGAPAIILLDGGGSALHYVVLLGATEDRVRLHDPNRGPYRELTLTELARRWGASGSWALLARPRGPARETGDPAVGRPPPRGSYESRPAPSDSAYSLLRSGATTAAAAEARRVLERRPGNSTARRVLATALYLAGREREALSEWNVLGEPRIDLVDARGLGPLRYQDVVGPTGLRARALLTPGLLGTAQRRLEHLPAVAAARVDYRPLPDGGVEVTTFVRPETPWPGGATLAVQSARAVVSNEVGLAFGPFLPIGDRWTLGGRWAEAQRSASAAAALPVSATRGVATVGLSWVSEAHAVAPGGRVDHTAASLSLARWMHAGLRMGATVGMDRVTSERLGRLGLDATVASAGDGLRLTTRLSGWAGEVRQFGRADVALDVERTDHRTRAWRLRAGATIASGNAPRTLWPGAGTGQVRKPLLRAHPLVRDGVVAGPAFAPRLARATLEHRRFLRLGPLVAGGLLFVDAARIGGASTAPNGPRAWIDVGVGAFADVGDRRAVAALARGVDGWVVSANVARRR